MSNLTSVYSADWRVHAYKLKMEGGWCRCAGGEGWMGFGGEGCYGGRWSEQSDFWLRNRPIFMANNGLLCYIFFLFIGPETRFKNAKHVQGPTSPHTVTPEKELAKCLQSSHPPPPLPLFRSYALFWKKIFVNTSFGTGIGIASKCPWRYLQEGRTEKG